MARSRPPAARQQVEGERSSRSASASGHGDGWKDNDVAASDGDDLDPSGAEWDDIEPTGPPRWVPWLAFALSLLGLADSSYLTVTHFAHTRLFCPTSGFINCQAVTTSAESRLLGIPVAVLGLAYYVAMTAINVPALWHRRERWITWARLAMVVGGMAMVLWLLIAELFIIKNLCEYCTGVHIVTFALFVTVVITFPTMVGPRAVWDEWDDTDPAEA